MVGDIVLLAVPAVDGAYSAALNHFKDRREQTRETLFEPLPINKLQYCGGEELCFCGTK